MNQRFIHSTTPSPRPPTESFTFSAKEKDSETGLSYFGSRYYSSDLSIWLSIDPMSDKYASLSPYVYCADNPVKLVDPNGEAWEKEEDQQMANSMIEIAQNKINKLDERINNLMETVKTEGRTRKMDDVLNELLHQRNYLAEGIDYLTIIERSSEKYHFKKLEEGMGFSCKRDDGIIDINYVDMAMAWHECVHIGDSKFNPSMWTYSKDNCLGTTEENFAKAEYHAFKSQFSFDPTGFIFPNSNEAVSNLQKVILWVRDRGFDQPLDK